MRKLLALGLCLLSAPAVAQGYINPPIYAPGKILVPAGTNVTTVVTNTRNPPAGVLNVLANGIITNWTVTLPYPAFDGEMITIGCPGGSVGTLTVNATAPDTVTPSSITTCTAGTGTLITYQYFDPNALGLSHGNWTPISFGGGGGSGLPAGGSSTTLLIGPSSAPVWGNVNLATMVTGSLNVSVTTQSAATYNYALSDKGTLVMRSFAGAMTDSLVSANYTAGWSTSVQNIGSGTISIIPTSGTIQGSASYSLPAGGGATIVFDGTNYYVLTGGAGTGGAGLTIGSTSITSGTAGRLLYDNNTLGEALIRYSAGVLSLGNTDAASPVAQTINTQNVLTGTTNTAGANLTISGSQGTGTGNGGKIIFQTAPAGGTGSTQNALSPILTLDAAGGIAMNTTTSGAFNWTSSTVNVLGLYWNGAGGFSNAAYMSNNAFMEDGTVSSRLTGPNDHYYAQSAAGGSTYWILADDGVVGAMSQRNSTVAQGYRVYKTFTDTSNYERGVVDWLTSANILTIGAQAAGTGTLRTVNIVGAGLQINGTAAVSCTAGTVNAATMVVTNGIVTHC